MSAMQTGVAALLDAALAADKSLYLKTEVNAKLVDPVNFPLDV